MSDQALKDTNRRRFIKLASLTIGAFPVLPLSFTGLLDACARRSAASDQHAGQTPSPLLRSGAPCGACIAPASLSWRTAITSPAEPGEVMEITGTIHQPGGVAPASGVVLFVYHTDATGYYNQNDDPSHPRLRGWMLTGSDGKYQFRTIKPAPYPRRQTPAHIHAHLSGPGYPERSIPEYWFEGDPFITAETLSNVGPGDGRPAIISLKRDAGGILRGVRDLTLSAA